MIALRMDDDDRRVALRLARTMMALTVPIVAAAHGCAIGGGLKFREIWPHGRLSTGE